MKQLDFIDTIFPNGEPKKSIYELQRDELANLFYSKVPIEIFEQTLQQFLVTTNTTNTIITR